MIIKKFESFSEYQSLDNFRDTLVLKYKDIIYNIFDLFQEFDDDDMGTKIEIGIWLPSNLTSELKSKIGPDIPNPLSTFISSRNVHLINLSDVNKVDSEWEIGLLPSDVTMISHLIKKDSSFQFLNGSFFSLYIYPDDYTIQKYFDIFQNMAMEIISMRMSWIRDIFLSKIESMYLIDLVEDGSTEEENELTKIVKIKITEK
jgi:hypothetical protein